MLRGFVNIYHEEAFFVFHRVVCFFAQVLGLDPRHPALVRHRLFRCHHANLCV